MTRSSRIAKRIFITGAMLLTLAYIIFLSPTLGNFERTAQAQNLNITNIVMQYVNRYYVDKPSIEPKNLFIKALGRLERIVDEVLVGFPDGEDGRIVEVQVVNKKQTFDMGEIQNLDDVTNQLEQIFEFITPNLTSKDLEINEVEYAVLDEMLKTLVSHS